MKNLDINLTLFLLTIVIRILLLKEHMGANVDDIVLD